MKKKAELLQKINAMRKSVVDLLAAEKLDEARAESEKLKNLCDEYDKMPDDKTAGGKVVNNMDKKELKKAINMYLHRGFKALDDAQRKLLKPVDATDTPGQVETVTDRGGVLVPVEVADFVATMDTGVYRLRTRVSEYFVNTLSGRIPLANNPTAGLVQLFDEFPEENIKRSEIKFGAVDWKVKDFGLIIPVSNDLMSDANADVIAIISEQFFRAQVITENSMILAAIDANGDATKVTGWKEILRELNGTAPIGSPEKVVVTNVDGWNYLDTLTDDQGHPILTQALVDNPHRNFRGYEVIQLPNETLHTDETTGIPFYVGSLRDAVYLIERKGLEIAYNPWSDSAYQKNAVDVRVTCRMDCKTKFAKAVKKLTLAQ